ncbi:hypothetical protein SDC9_206486 [bioreactor metagenome]|uniref:HTH cro/C1-type domain-containing protein n=1 Tax=bioreactor metagenome TaxID=1076179 RepID=A0A645J6M4_9ZZZZ
MNERLSILRKTLDLSQEEMGIKLGVKKSTISRLERGLNNFTEQMIKLINNEFLVNEHWLRTGEGEMFNTKYDNESSENILLKVLENQELIIKDINFIKHKLSKLEEDIFQLENS